MQFNVPMVLITGSGVRKRYRWEMEDEQLILLSSLNTLIPAKVCVRPFKYPIFSACVLFPNQSVKLHQLTITKWKSNSPKGHMKSQWKCTEYKLGALFYASLAFRLWFFTRIHLSSRWLFRHEFCAVIINRGDISHLFNSTWDRHYRASYKWSMARLSSAGCGNCQGRSQE